jgi:Flp pilus assembly protein CpaB
MYVKDRLSAAQPKLDTAPIVVAAEDITYGTKLTPDHLRLASFRSVRSP